MDNNFNNISTSPVDLDVNEFKKKYFKSLSHYFNNIFYDYFKKIIVIQNDNKNGIIIFDVELDEKCANPLNIAHGGALATLIENLATVSLLYFTNSRYKTLDISVNFKNQVELNQIFQVYVNCQKIGYPTSFVEVEVRKDNQVCTQGSIIQSKFDKKIEPKF
jgi:acyl-coenzyme A thioesterase PaaI-like protein